MHCIVAYGFFMKCWWYNDYSSYVTPDTDGVALIGRPDHGSHNFRTLKFYSVNKDVNVTLFIYIILLQFLVLVDTC